MIIILFPIESGESRIQAQILEILEERVKPYVQQDGGDVEFDRFDRADGGMASHKSGFARSIPMET